MNKLKRLLFFKIDYRKKMPVAFTSVAYTVSAFIGCIMAYCLDGSLDIRELNL